jgi:hypothetical protein
LELVLTNVLHRTPQDIKADTTTKDLCQSNENPKTDKSLSPNSAEDVPEVQEPHDLNGVKDSPKKAKAPNSPAAAETPRTEKPPSPSGAESSPSPAESAKKLASPSPQPHGFGAAGGAPGKGESTQHNVETPLQTSLRVADSLPKDPDFIKARFHIGRFVTVAVNTKAHHAEIQALQSDMDSAALHINVRLHTFCCFALLPVLDPDSASHLGNHQALAV